MFCEEKCIHHIPAFAHKAGSPGATAALARWLRPKRCDPPCLGSDIDAPSLPRISVHWTKTYRPNSLKLASRMIEGKWGYSSVIYINKSMEYILYCTDVDVLYEYNLIHIYIYTPVV